MRDIPVITFDGPSGAGKGTISALLAQHLGFHLLDSGSLYRSIAWSVLRAGVDFESSELLQKFLDDLDLEIRLKSPANLPEIYCQGQEVSLKIRAGVVGSVASSLAEKPEVRQYLMQYQRMMRKVPGLVADGRDMGSLVFLDASVKIYLDASLEVRTKRRYKQLIDKGISVSVREIREDLSDRDYRDENRDLAPLKIMPDMTRIDTSDLVVKEVFPRVLGVVQKHLPIN